MNRKELQYRIGLLTDIIEALCENTGIPDEFVLRETRSHLEKLARDIKRDEKPNVKVTGAPAHGD